MESGMRTGDLKQVEEYNRLIVAHLADVNFCNHENNVNNLKKEGIADNKIYLTGSTIFSALNRLNVFELNEDENKLNWELLFKYFCDLVRLITLFIDLIEDKLPYIFQLAMKYMAEGFADLMASAHLKPGALIDLCRAPAARFHPLSRLARLSLSWLRQELTHQEPPAWPSAIQIKLRVGPLRLLRNKLMLSAARTIRLAVSEPLG